LLPVFLVAGCVALLGALAIILYVLLHNPRFRRLFRFRLRYRSELLASQAAVRALDPDAMPVDNTIDWDRPVPGVPDLARPDASLHEEDDADDPIADGQPQMGRDRMRANSTGSVRGGPLVDASALPAAGPVVASNSAPQGDPQSQGAPPRTAARHAANNGGGGGDDDDDDDDDDSSDEGADRDRVALLNRDRVAWSARPAAQLQQQRRARPTRRVFIIRDMIDLAGDVVTPTEVPRYPARQ
jgi:hypothetical protein